MAQPSYLASGTKPLVTDTKSRRWAKILGHFQNLSGAKLANNPLRTDTVWKSKYKILRALNAGTSGGGGGGGGGGGPTNDPDVNLFISCAGISDPTQIAAVLQLATSFKSNNLWTSMDAVYPFVGGNAQSHSCNFKNSNQYRITWHGNVTHNANGITGDGSTAYGDTGFNPSTAGGQFAVNSSSMGVYGKTSSIPLGGYFMGCEDGSTLSWFSAFNTSPGSYIVQAGGMSDSVLINNASESNFSGNIDFSRTGASTQAIYSHSGTTAANQTSTGLTNASIYILADNKSGPLGPIAANLAFAFIGGGFTSGQVSTLQTIITAYETALNRQ